jgi:hypothetical protein
MDKLQQNYLMSYLVIAEKNTFQIDILSGAYYLKSKKLVVINNSHKKEQTKIFDFDKNGMDVSIKPYGMKIIGV